jgi:chemotaxis protein CheC
MTTSTLSESGEARLASLCDAGGHAVASALGRFVGRDGPLDVTSEVVSFSHVSMPDERLVAVAFDLSGAVHGSMVQLVGDETAAALIGRLLGEEPAGAAYGARERGALSEVGNIVASAFLNALADSLKRACLPSVPRFLHGPGTDVLTRALRDADGQEPAADARIFRVEVDLGNAPGHLVLLAAPTAETIEQLATTTKKR